MEGEHLELTSTLDYGHSKEDGMYNVVSTCAYGATVDTVTANDKWNDIQKELETKGLSKEEIEFEKDNWFLIRWQNESLFLIVMILSLKV